MKIKKNIKKFNYQVINYKLYAVKLIIKTNRSILGQFDDFIFKLYKRSNFFYFNPLTPRCPLSPKFQFYFKKGSSKKILWALRLWVGRRKEPILGYVSKNDEKKNLVLKGLKKMKISILH